MRSSGIENHPQGHLWKVGERRSAPLSAAMQLFYRGIHSAYHTVVPYRMRIILWEYRRRRLRAFKEYAQARNRKLIEQCKTELRQIIAQSPDAKGVVIFPRSVAWDTPLFQRPHQMAMAFASLGYLVFYWVQVDSIDNVARFRKVNHGLYLCNVAPEVLRCVENPIVITYTYTYNWTAQLKSSSIVYELIDRLEIFSNFPLPLLRHYHKKLLSQATVVVGTANELLEDLAQHRPDAILCPNGVDYDHFASNNKDIRGSYEDIQRIIEEGKPIVGYYGALAEWFDYDLMKHAAKALPGYNFVLIGPDYDFSIGKTGITKLANIHWLGPKNYHILPKYLHAFDIATIPFQITKTLQAVSPIKLFEYMAGGRPIVTTDLVECRKYPIVLVAKNQDEFVGCLQRAMQLRDEPAYLAALKTTAQENTWHARARTIITAIEAKQTPPFSSISNSKESRSC